MAQTEVRHDTQTPVSNLSQWSLQQTLLWLLSTLAVLVLGLPLVGLVWRGLVTRGWDGLTASGVPEAILLSFVTTGITLIMAVILGTPLAYVLARRRFPLKGLVNILIELPIVLPPAVAGLALLITFGRRGLVGGFFDSAFGVSIPFTTAAVILAQLFVSMPFYVRSAVVGLTSVPRTLEDAARVDGASEPELFFWITLPLAGNAMLAGLLLSWARAIGEFGATLLFAGSLRGVTQTMPILIYSVLERDINAAIWTGILLVALASGALSLSRLLTRVRLF